MLGAPMSPKPKREAAEPAPFSTGGKSIHGIAFSGDGQRIASSIAGGKLALWDASSGQWLNEVSTDEERVGEVHYCRTGAVIGIATSGLWGWDPESGELGRRIALLPDSYRQMSVSSDDRLVAITQWDRVQVFVLETGKLVAELEEEKIESVSFLPGGGELLAASGSGLVLWDLAHQVVTGMPGIVAFDRAWVSASPDGTAHLVTDGSGRIQVRSIPRGHRVELKSLGAWVWSMAWSPDCALVAAGDRKGQLGVWRADDGRLLYRLRGHSGSITSVRFSPDGRVLASSGFDGVIGLWDAKTGSCLNDAVFAGMRGKIETKLHKKLAKLKPGDASSLYEYAIAWLEVEPYQSYLWLLIAADAGNNAAAEEAAMLLDPAELISPECRILALFQLGCWFDEGIHVAQDRAKAKECFEQCAASAGMTMNDRAELQDALGLPPTLDLRRPLGPAMPGTPGNVNRRQL